tara:strand:- start:7596 stop:8558 length:963 start_codon:yes stop_codon:yes gene_type:complete
MGCEAYTTFSKVSNIGDTLLSSEIENNLKWYLDWALLGVGGWSNINIPTSGTWGGNYDALRLVNDPAYENGRVWETARKDWVWESGSSYSGYDPIQVSGVYVNGALYGTGDVTYGHHYDYPLGRVVFDNAISTTSSVKAEYSYRNVQVYVADEAPWWDELQYNSLRVDDTTYSATGSGSWGILANHRVQMPSIVLEVVPRRRFTPYQMGDTSQFVKQDVLFHIVAESRWWRNQLVDIISLQKDSQLWLFNSNTLISSGVFPLDYRGMRVTNPLNYNDIVKTPQYRYVSARFTDMAVTEMLSHDARLHEGTVRATIEVVLD